MKILFIYLGTLKSSASGVIRNRAFIQGAFENGHTVDVVMLDDHFNINYDEDIVLNNISKIQLVTMGSIYKAIVRRRRCITPDSVRFDKEDGSGLKRILQNKISGILKHMKYITSFDIRAFNKEMIKIDNDYDLVVSSSDPAYSHMYAYHLLRKNRVRCPWIQYWGDPLTDDVNFKPNEIERLIVKIREKRILKNADSIVYTSPLTRKVQQELFPIYKNKMIFVNQACLKEDDQDNLVYEDDNYTIGYFGDFHSRTRNLTPLVKAIRDNDHIKLIIVGNGDLESGLCIPSNVEIYGRCKSKKLKDLKDKARIIVGVCNKGGSQIPAKFYYEAGCKKPIIIVVDGEYKNELIEYFNSFGRYIVCRNEIEEIKCAVTIAIQDIQQTKEYNLPNEMHTSVVSKRIIDAVARGEND